MSRMDVAYLLILLMSAAVLTAVFLTRRFQRYRRELRRGNRKAKPVWKPFWIEW